MKTRIVYLLLLAVTAYFGLLFYSGALLGLFVLELLLPLISFVLLRIVLKKLHTRVHLPIGVAEKRQPVAVGVEIQNDSRVPLVRIQADMILEHGFYDSQDPVTLYGMADGRKKTRLLTTIQGDRCGLVTVRLKQLIVWDFLRLFTGKITLKEDKTLALLPDFYEITLPFDQLPDYVGDSEEFDKDKPGDDPSEIFQVREYREGDRLSSIHWKMSARTDELIVKDYSLPIKNDVLLFFDGRTQAGEKPLDDFLELGLAVSRSLIQAEVSHILVWVNKKSGQPRWMPVRQEEELYTFIEEVFATGFSEELSPEELYGRTYREHMGQAHLVVNRTCELWKDEEQLEAALQREES